MSLERNVGKSSVEPPDDERKVLVFCPSLVRSGAWSDQAQGQGFRFGRYYQRQKRWMVEGVPTNVVVEMWWELPRTQPIERPVTRARQPATKPRLPKTEKKPAGQWLARNGGKA